MSDPAQVFVLPGLRSPFCKIDRELGSLDALAVSVPVVQQTVAGDSGVGPGHSGQVDLVLWGAVIPSLTVSNWAREVWLDAGLDASVPTQTIVQACATSLAAAAHAAGQVRAGRVELALCGGVEAVSDTQIGLSKGMSRTLRRTASAGRPVRAVRTLGQLRLRDLRISIPAVAERTTGLTMGQHAERTAKEWKIPREDQDRLALESHRRALAEDGAFYRPLLVTPGTYAVDRDPIPRSDSSLEKLARLRPAFDRQLGTLTAGNSSLLTDGAAACWITSSTGLDRLPDSLPRARLLDWEEAGVDPRREGLLMAPALAVPRLLARHDLGYDDVDLWEIHEAFAAQVLCNIKALEDRAWLSERARVDRDLGRFPMQRMNPNGGSIALGHPFGATGARLLSQAVRELTDEPAGTRAVVSVCAAGGLGHVALLEAV
jgi:acetyl-CoA C-acetyltransferase